MWDLRLKRHLSLVWFGVILSLGNTAWSAQSSFEPFVIQGPAPAGFFFPNLPDWADPFGNFKLPETHFFQINKVMREFSLTRAQAVEAQGLLRERIKNHEVVDPLSGLQSVVAQVRKNTFRHFELRRISAAKFVVVLDLDETLWDQSSKMPPGCADVNFNSFEGKPKSIKFAPGVKLLIEGIRKLGGEVVLFSANSDEVTFDGLRHWKWNNETLASTSEVAGKLAFSSLILQDSNDPAGALLVASKDLRIVDESLSKVIIVDDNPTKIFQNRNHRQIRKFKGDLYCMTLEQTIRQAFDLQLLSVLHEIQETLQYLEANRQATFAGAYLPYSALGQIAANFLRSSLAGYSEGQIRGYIRRHPEVVDGKF